MRYFFLFMAVIFRIGAWASVEAPDFDRAMGFRTTAWNHIRTPEDKRLLAYFKEGYGQIQKLDNKSIPKVLHWVWLGPSPFPQESVNRMEKWIRMHPDWVFKLWTDQKREKIPSEVILTDPLKALGELSECYFSCDNFGERSEIVRLAILALEGGIYIDHDVEPLKPLAPLVEGLDFFCGLEVLKPTFLSSSIYPSTHLIGSAAAHPIILFSLDWLLKHWGELEVIFPGTEEKEVISRVKHRSFRALHQGIQNVGIGNGSAVFPASFFSQDHPEKGVYAIHHHLGSWFNKKEELEMQKDLFSVQKRVSLSTWGITFLSICNFGIGLILLKSFRKKRRLACMILGLCLTVKGFSLDTTPDYHNFFSLMGKETPHWKYVSQKEDLLLLDWAEALYQKNKAAQFIQGGEYRIPPVIHLIWLGPKTFPPESVENLRSWIAYHPEWKIKLWTDRKREPPCEGIEMVDITYFHFSYLENCFNSSSNWGEKSDLLRYEILYQEGGIYVDHDAYCIASFEGLAKGYDFFCCLEPPHEPFVGLNITCWNGLIGSKPGHKALLNTIEKVAACWETVGNRLRGKDLYSQVEVVMQRTYITFTEAMRGSLDLDGNCDIIFPAAYFFAKSKMPSIYSKHFCHTTWDGFKFRRSEMDKFYEKVFKKILNENNRMLYLAGGSLLLSFFFLSYSVLRISRC